MKQAVFVNVLCALVKTHSIYLYILNISKYSLLLLIIFTAVVNGPDTCCETKVTKEGVDGVLRVSWHI